MAWASYIIAAFLVAAFLFRRRLLLAAPVSNAPEQQLTKVRISAEAGLFAVE